LTDELHQTTLEKERVELQHELLKETSQKTQKALQDEIDSLKSDLVNPLKESNEILSKGLEEQKRANLVSGSSPLPQQQAALFAEEKLKKAELEIARLRDESLLEINKQHKLQKELIEKEVALRKKEQEIANLNYEQFNSTFLN